VAKIGVVVEKADESVFWLDLLADTAIIRRGRLEDLLREANELLAILAAPQHTARKTGQSRYQ
jgi:hypothetical protein